MLFPGDRVGIAVSGGADSMVLLEILHRLSGRFGVVLMVLHVNHALRGVESEDDESFVRAAARRLELPVAVGAYPLARQSNVEAEARHARRVFFAECRRVHGLSRIALGHTRSDQAETVLQRILRGTGTRGLAAMRYVTPEGLMRPLLATSRQEVRSWASEMHIAWRDDSSNHDLRFTRNRLRLETLPALARDYNPNLESVLSSAALVAQDEEEYWNAQVEKLYTQISKRTRLGCHLAVPEMSALSVALRRRVVRRALQDIRPNGMRGLTFEHIEAVLRLLGSTQGHDRVLIPGVDALRSFETLLLCVAGRLAGEPRHYNLPITLGDACVLPYGLGQICVGDMKSAVPVCDKFKEVQELGVEQAWLSGAALEGLSLTIRNWEPGDELQRPGHRSAVKVKQLFQEHRTLLWERRHWPVLLCGEEIAWVRGFGIASRFAAAGNSGAIRVVYRTGAQGL